VTAAELYCERFGLGCRVSTLSNPCLPLAVPNIRLGAVIFSAAAVGGHQPTIPSTSDCRVRKIALSVRLRLPDASAPAPVVPSLKFSLFSVWNISS
jgi:hypothetical protein